MRCEEKKRYLDEPSASAAAAWVKAHRASSGPAYDPFHETLGAYMCPQCAYWHIGHDRSRIHELGPIVDPRHALKKAIKKAAKTARKAAKARARAKREAAKIKVRAERSAWRKATASSCYGIMIKNRVLMMS